VFKLVLSAHTLSPSLAPQSEGDGNREAAALLALESFLGESIRIPHSSMGFICRRAQPSVNGFIQVGTFRGEIGLHRIQQLLKMTLTCMPTSTTMLLIKQIQQGCVAS